jgi:hypothetical protein
VTFDSCENLWGATSYGGFCQLGEGGSCFGIIFLLVPPATAARARTETMVHHFSKGNENPISGVVVDRPGALYGVTYVETHRFFGGAVTVIGSFSDISPNAYAPTVYKLTPPASGHGPWAQTILHSPHGVPFGTTQIGGIGCGTVFQVVP